MQIYLQYVWKCTLFFAQIKKNPKIFAYFAKMLYFCPIITI